MKYFSTRNSKLKFSASEAISKGLASDGGLFVPETIPHMSEDEIKTLLPLDYCKRAVNIMSKYLDEFDETELTALVNAAYGTSYDDPAVAPLHILDNKTAVLELYHGPTCAFKDMALQLLPHLLTASLKKCGEKRKVCILVATSGDTGKAALEGFADVEGTMIQVFYPDGGVSEAQKLQMITQKGNNVGVTAVKGNFDDAQSGVKKIFSDREFAEELNENGSFLSSANSINWGRLLPQIVYYFSAYCDYVNSGCIAFGEEVDFCVPTGNFGNILAGWYAMKMGLPVGRLICASNENNVLTDFIETGVYDRKRSFKCTLSPSMDILVSSNLERLLYNLSGSDTEVSDYMSSLAKNGEYTVGDELKSAIKERFEAGYCDDTETLATIKAVWDEYAYLMDTHTAVAYKVLSFRRRAREIPRPTVIVSTASPFKFSDSVLAALGESTDDGKAMHIEKLSELCGIAPPTGLSGLESREKRFNEVVAAEDMKETVRRFLL